MGSSVGLVVAAILVVLGGGISTLMMGGKTVDPIDQFTLIVQRSEDVASVMSYAELAAKLEAAQVMLRQGHPAQATSIVGDVRSHLEEIDPAKRQDLLARITRIEGAIRARQPNSPTELGDRYTAPQPDALNSGLTFGWTNHRGSVTFVPACIRRCCPSLAGRHPWRALSRTTIGKNRPALRWHRETERRRRRE